MPRKRTNKKADSAEMDMEVFDNKKDNLQTVRPPKLLAALASVFFIIWIIIGVFVLAVVVQGNRRGAFSQLLSSREISPTDAPGAPAETTLRGIGRVNIACVKDALSPESIQKLVTSGDSSFLQGDEKTKFEACIIEKESPGPSATPASK